MPQILKLTFLIFLSWQNLFGQTPLGDSSGNVNKDNFADGWFSGHNNVTGSVGMHTYQLDQMRQGIKNNYGLEFSPYLLSTGISATETIRWGRKITWDQHLNFYYLSSFPFSDKSPSEVGARISGFYFGYDFCKDLFPINLKFDILTGLGFNAGRLTFNFWDNKVTDHYLKYTNPFFAPMVSVDARVFLFQKIFISLRGDGQYDITKNFWRKKSDLLPNLENGKATGYGFYLSIGLGL